MTKADMIRKFTSRKFWFAVVAFVSAILTAFNVPEASAAQVTSIIMAFGALIAYIFAEGWADASRALGQGMMASTEETEDEQD
ncbi:hypothetical protein [Lachnoclostridium sp. Marseille-P6806]|uniref:hypothetical protein n=1 Tax=Lachnoclostridium sp. Marseille-P6806 TaxID=2364793 RepID=UPI0010303FCC|nr:hypothetical protein [Lachnoclostridium sp. Marseille-P6806]